MPTPRIPAGLKPLAQGYSIGAPDGVNMSEVGGGLPRVAMEWDRGRQAFPVAFSMSEYQFSAWDLFFHHVIRNGSLQFDMPINSGQGFADHTCIMVPGTYSVTPQAASRRWIVTFTVVAEAQAYEMTTAEAQAIIDFYEAAGEGGDLLLARLAKFATVDTLVLVP